MRGLYLTQNRESARRDFIRKASKLGGNKKGASQLSNRRNRLLLFQFFYCFTQSEEGKIIVFIALIDLEVCMMTIIGRLCIKQTWFATG